MLVVEWIENAEFVCKLCEMDKVEYVLTLQLRGGALPVNWQQNNEQRSDSEKIKIPIISSRNVRCV